MTEQQVDDLARRHAGGERGHLPGTEPPAFLDFIARHRPCRLGQQLEKYVMPFVQASELEQVTQLVTLKRRLFAVFPSGSLHRRLVALYRATGQRPSRPFAFDEKDSSALPAYDGGSFFHVPRSHYQYY
ncbi:hypothetical protein PUN4_180142 [Paraburkholderia unamae]|nr:hypothetical protein PUN4_180142 [Paraburkholderia unamae]